MFFRICLSVLVIFTHFACFSEDIACFFVSVENYEQTTGLKRWFKQLVKDYDRIPRKIVCGSVKGFIGTKTHMQSIKVRVLDQNLKLKYIKTIKTPPGVAVDYASADWYGEKDLSSESWVQNQLPALKPTDKVVFNTHFTISDEAIIYQDGHSAAFPIPENGQTLKDIYTHYE